MSQPRLRIVDRGNFEIIDATIAGNPKDGYVPYSEQAVALIGLIYQGIASGVLEQFCQMLGLNRRALGEHMDRILTQHQPTHKDLILADMKRTLRGNAPTVTLARSELERWVLVLGMED